HDVDLVAAERPVLVLPKRPRLRMHGEALRAAMAERVYLGQVTVFADKRIVGRNGAVVAQPQYLAAVLHRVLRTLLLLALADGDVEHAVAAEDHAAAEVRRRRAPVLCDEDVAHVVQRAAVEAAARDRGRRKT